MLARALGVAMCALVAASCSTKSSATSKPSDLINDPAVQAALKDIGGRPRAANEDPDAESCVAVAPYLAQNASYFDSSAQGLEPAAPNVTGTWNFISCENTDADTFPQLSSCAGTVAWTGQEGGKITQQNQGGVSSGSGAVSFIAQIPASPSSPTPGAVIIQSNDASGAGCEQSVVNLIYLTPVPTENQAAAGGQWSMTTIDVIKTSTCGAPKWKCAFSYLAH